MTEPEPSTGEQAPLLDMRGLGVTIEIGGRPAEVVRDLSLTLADGEVLGIVGESGCGKTVTARSIIGLDRTDSGFRLGGQMLYRGRDLLALDEHAMRAIRGKEIAMIFQDPMTSLNPLHRIGAQIGETLGEHTALSKAAIRARTINLLRQVGIPHPERRVDDYPHQFSGGMRQRVMIAMALACEPALLIADEPTTALDVTTQLQILDLLARLKDDYRMAVILITHDLGVVAEIADRVMVMYAGQCVEHGTTRDVFHAPKHPYTAGLLAAMPSADRPKVARLSAIKGSPPRLTAGLPSGCAFAPRCDHVFAPCSEMPPLAAHAAAPDHRDRCWLPAGDRPWGLDPARGTTGSPA
ncbi:MAG: ABC transporter ATP-binding protein [Bauldia litoralis]|uniref:ABC transporter ATP-binding protein n=1 Tax=Bauldia litoralis TaxID=665467 RepID=UPI003296C599